MTKQRYRRPRRYGPGMVHNFALFCIWFGVGLLTAALFTQSIYITAYQRGVNHVK